MHPWLEFNTSITIDIDTLKNFCDEHKIDNIDFIHMYVQGAELKVLQGANELIGKIKSVWLEVEKVALYENQALKIDFQGDKIKTGIEFRPAQPIDATQFKNFCLVFDATNITPDYSVQIFVSIENEKGHSISRSDVVPIGKTHTYFFELAGKYVGKDTGLRDDPKPWENESIHMKIRGLKTDIDFSKIHTNKKWLKSVFNAINLIKVPFPAIEFNRIQGVRFRPIYF